MKNQETKSAVEIEPVEIELARRFRKLIPEIDNFSVQLGERVGYLSLVCIAQTLEPNGTPGRLYHGDGVFEFAYLNPGSNGDCLARILHTDGKTEDVRFSYYESGILVPDDQLSRKIIHPGLLRKPHPVKSIKEILERRTNEPAFINDDVPKGNSIYSLRILGDINGIGYNANVRNDNGINQDIKFGYDSLAGVLVSDEKFTGELTVRRFE